MSGKDTRYGRHYDALVRAAARILARHHRPDWRPPNEDHIDTWGAGYLTGWKQGYLDATSQEPR